MYSATLCLLFVSCAIRTQLFAINVSVGVDLIVAVHKHYRSACIVLVHDGIEETWSLLAKRLSHYGIAFGQIHIRMAEKFSEQTECHNKVPLYLLPSSDQKSQHFLHEVSKSSNMSSGKWLMFLDPVISLEDFFLHIHVPVDCEFLVAQNSGVESEKHVKMALTEVYHVHPSLPLQKERVGNWSSATGVVWSAVPFYERRADLQGTTIKATLMDDGAFVHFKYDENHKPVEFYGYMIDLWRNLEKELNFTTQYQVCEGGLYGALKNNQWNGMMKMIVEDEVEFAIAGFAFSLERMDAVNFLVPTRNFKMRVYIRQAETEESSGNFIMSPFTKELWWTIFMTIIVTLVAFIADWMIRLKYGLQKSDDLPSSLFCIFSIFLQQGEDSRHQLWSCRLIILTSCTTALLLLVGYSATLTSFLAVRSYTLPFTDFEGLLNDGSYRFIFGSGSVHLSYFKESKNSVLQEVYKKLIEPEMGNLPKSEEEGLRMMCRNKKMAYFGGDMAMRIARNKKTCSILSIDKTSYPVAISIPIVKKSPYRRIFNAKMQAMLRSGILSRLAKRWWPPLMHDTPGDTPTTVTIKTAKILFLLLATGAMSSALFIIMEVAFRKAKQNNFWRSNVKGIYTQLKAHGILKRDAVYARCYVPTFGRN